MRKYNSIYKILITIILLGLLWITLFFLVFALPPKKAALTELLPDDTDMVLSVNMHQLLSTLFIDATYKTKLNPEDLAALKDKRISKENLFKGVDFNNEVVFFYDSWKNELVKGLLFNLSNEKKFNQISTAKDNVIKASNHQQGIFIYLDKNASQETIDHYTRFAQEAMKSKKSNGSYPHLDGIMNLNFKGNHFSYIQDLTVNVKMKDEHLILKGKGQLDSILPLKKMHMLETPSDRKYFEIQSGKLPDSVFKHLDGFMQQLNIQLPRVTSQQVLLYGIAIENYRGSPLILPKMDLVLRFDSLVVMDSLLKNIDKDVKHIKVEGHFIEIGNVKYYYQQLSDNEIYLGVTETPKTSYIETRVLPLTKGFPSVILDIKGKGIIARIINLLPQVKNTKMFLKDVDYYDIHSEFITDNKLKIDGKIRLEKGKMMSVGLAEFMLKFIK